MFVRVRVTVAVASVVPDDGLSCRVLLVVNVNFEMVQSQIDFLARRHDCGQCSNNGKRADGGRSPNVQVLTTFHGTPCSADNHRTVAPVCGLITENFMAAIRENPGARKTSAKAEITPCLNSRIDAIMTYIYRRQTGFSRARIRAIAWRAQELYD